MRDEVNLLNIESEGISRGRWIGFREVSSIPSIKSSLWETLARCRRLVVGFEDHAG